MQDRTQHPTTDGASADGHGVDPAAGPAVASSGTPSGTHPSWRPTGSADPGEGAHPLFDRVPGEAPAPSPLDAFEPERPPRRGRRALVAVGVPVLLLGAYAGASWALADRVPRGASVAGVAIGGLGADEAVRALEDGLADRAAEPVAVTAQDVRAQVQPAEAGLTLDARATVDALTGFDLLQPAHLWYQLVGVGAREPVTTVDEDRLEAAVEALEGPLALAPVDGAVLFVDGAPERTDAAEGWSLDAAGAREVLVADWLDAAQPLPLPTEVVEPAVDDEAAQAALVEVAEPLVSAPVSVQVRDRLAVLEPATLAAAARMVPQDGGLVLDLDGAALADAVLAQVPDLLTPAADARFEFVDDRPVVVPGTPGTSLDAEALAAAVTAASTAEERTAAVELVETDPEQSAQELEALGVTQVVSEFATPLTSEPRRTVNITNGAAKINGTLVRPGEEFSLTEALGPIDAAHGYVEAGAIVSGEHTDAWGGGLSQVSTTTFNAAYLAGMVDVEHKPHSEWFSRYPAGREATIFTGVLDMRWANDTPHGALVQAWVSDGQMHVRLWGTPYWTVETSTSGRSRVVQPTTVYSQSPTCEPQSAGNPGFTITVTRTKSAQGVEPRTEQETWTYKPQNQVVCGPDPADAPPPADEGQPPAQGGD
ncbi:VanW family protein [Cellulomonas marina]|uniref:Vancomycin resistance protein YoaR, contains peptidoglycan-binding and VanW domains n=1 Tax=Cellulomonas marina TaxID=988821 RepID=A0A1I0ZI00_9CELL|nr:VanW family protein [Cellulomonas marina]GIG28603.1 vanomycin resistance protein VanB [Cellulomonas marina]SFB25275.1 Vancomycin resistance protein YoaR, contains peptidoglycan-binding and VanW domains [Cellulomonas marina]